MIEISFRPRPSAGILISASFFFILISIYFHNEAIGTALLFPSLDKVAIVTRMQVTRFFIRLFSLSSPQFFLWVMVADIIDTSMEIKKRP